MAVFSTIGAWVAAAAQFLAASVGFSAATAAAFGTAVGQLGVSLVSSILLRALAPKPSIPRSEIQAVINQGDAPRRVYVGRNLVGGIRALFDVKGSVLYQLVMVNHGKIAAFEECWADGKPLTLGAGGWVSEGPMSGYVYILTRDGAGDGGNYSVLYDHFSSWPSTSKLTGQATFLVAADAPGDPNNYQKAYPKGYGTLFQWVIRGSEIFDPRNAAIAYSDNAALVQAFYLTHDGGYRLASSEIDWSSVVALADWCDLPIPQKAGGTAPNMRLWGYWTLDEEPAQVLDRMAGSSGIRVYETEEGKVGLIGGPFGEPAMTLTAKDIRQIQTSEAISEREGFNTLLVSFMSADHKFELIEVDPWRDEPRLLQEGEIAQEFRPEMCPNQSQARRLAKRYVHDHNRAKVEVVTNLVGLKARFPKHHGQRHTIMLDYRPEDGSGRVIQGEYEVTDHEFDPINLECRIVLERVDRASEAWVVDEEGALPAPLPAPEENPDPGIEPALTQQVVALGNGVYAAYLQVTAPAPEGFGQLGIEAQYREYVESGPANHWLPMAIVGERTAATQALPDGKTYEVRVRNVGIFDGEGEWEMLGPITIVANPNAPAAPTELIASPGIGSVHISVRAPSSNTASLRIYRGTTSAFASASVIGSVGAVLGQISEYSDHTAVASVLYYYWVVAANSSGVEGPPVGPATITL